MDRIDYTLEQIAYRLHLPADKVKAAAYVLATITMLGIALFGHYNNWWNN